MANTNETYEIKIQTAGDIEVAKLKQNITDLYKQLNILNKKKTSITVDSGASEIKLAFVKEEITKVIDKIKSLENQKLKLVVENKEKFTNDLNTASENLKRVNKEIQDLGGKRLKVGGEIDFKEIDLINARLVEIMSKHEKLTILSKNPIKFNLSDEQIIQVIKNLDSLEKEYNSLMDKQDLILSTGNTKQYIDEVNESLKQLNINKRKFQEDKKIAKEALINPDAVANVKALDDKLFVLQKKLSTLTSTKLKLETDPKFEAQLNQNAKAMDTIKNKIEETKRAILEEARIAEQAAIAQKTASQALTDSRQKSIAMTNLALQAEKNFATMSAKAANLKEQSLKKEQNAIKENTFLVIEAELKLAKSLDLRNRVFRKSTEEQIQDKNRVKQALIEYDTVAKQLLNDQVRRSVEASKASQQANNLYAISSNKVIEAQKKVTELSKIAADEQKKATIAMSAALNNNTKENIKASNTQQNVAQKAIIALDKQMLLVKQLSEEEKKSASLASSAAAVKTAAANKVIEIEKKIIAYQQKSNELTKQKSVNFTGLIQSLNSLRDAASNLMPIATMLNGVGKALTNLAKSAIQEAVTWQVLRMKLSNFYNTATESAEAFNYLVIKAKTTPFEIKGLVQAAVMLRAFGINMKEGIELTGNLAAALGGKITDAAYAMSRAMSGASMGFLMLQRTWGVSRSKLKALGAEFMAGNRLMASSVKTQKALLAVLKENEGAMDRLSKTAEGRLSNLKDAVDTLQESAGRAFLPLFEGVVSVATKITDAFAKMPDSMKVTAVAIAGLSGGLAIITSKAISTAIAVSQITLALVQFTAAINAGMFTNIGSQIAATIPIFKQLFTVSTAGTSALTALSNVAATATMHINIGLASIGTIGTVAIGAALGIAAIAATLTAVYIAQEKLKTAALIKETTKDIDLMRGSLSKLRNYYPETYSQAAIFNNIITHSSAALLNAADSTYKLKEKLVDLFGMTEEEFIKQKEDVRVGAENHFQNFKNAIQREEDLLAEHKRKLKNVTTVGEVDFYLEEIKKSEKQLDFLIPKMTKWENILKDINERYADGQYIFEKYTNEYNNLQEALAKAKDKESFEPFNVLDQVENINKMRNISKEIEKDFYKQAEADKDKKIFSIEASYNQGEGPRIDSILTNKETYSKAIDTATQEYYDEMKMLDKDFLKFQANNENEKIRLRKESDEVYNKIHKISLDDLITMEATAMAAIERDKKANLFPTKEDYERAKDNAIQGFNDLRKIVIDSDATLKEFWKNTVTEQKNLLKSGELDSKTFINNMLEFQEYYGERLLTMPDLARDIMSEITNQIASDMKDSWTVYEKNLSNSLKNSEINYGEYLNNLETYLIDHEKELKNNLDLKLEIESKIATATKKLEEDTYKDRIKMAKDFVAIIYGVTEGAYIHSLNVLNKQRQEYIDHGNDKIEVDKWYYAQKELLDTEYRIKQKQNALKFANDLAKSQTAFGSLDQQRAEADAYYKEQMLQLEIQAKAYKDDKVAQVKIDKMVAGEKIRIEQERAEKVQAIRNEEQERALKFASDLAKSMTEFGSFDEAKAEANSYYNNQLAQLAIQAKEYEKQNMSKIKIDQFVSGERIRIETEHANKLQGILLQEEQFYDDMYRKVLDNFVATGELTEANYLRMQKKMLDESIKRHEEAAKIIEKNILAGNSVSKAEAEIYDVYIKQEQTLYDINEQLNTRLDSTGKIYDANMDILKQDLELKKLRGEISDEKALMIELKYRQDYLQTHKDEIEILRKKLESGKELTQIEQERLKTYLSESIEQENQLNNYEELTKASKTVKSEVTGVAEAASSATKSVDKLNSSMQNVANSTAKASNEMEQYGHILAGAADTTSGIGNFGTMESMLSNLPGTSSVPHEELPYDLAEVMGRSLADREMWSDVFDGFYEELGEKTIAANRRAYEEEMAEKKEFWKKEFETTSLSIDGMATDTKTAMDSMATDINTFSQKEVVVNVTVDTPPPPASPPDSPDSPPNPSSAGGGNTSPQQPSTGNNNPAVTGNSYNLGDILQNTSGLTPLSGGGNNYLDNSGNVIHSDPSSANNIQTVIDLFDISNNLNEPRNKTEHEKAIRAFGFDNPANDAIAKSLGAKQSTSIINILQKNTTDILKNYLKGTADAVKKMYSSTVSNNSNIHNNNINNSKISKSTVYNTNFNGQVSQYTPVPIQRSVKTISDYATRGRYSGGKL